MSLNWFDPARLDEQAEELFARLAPLYQSVSGERGLLVDFALIPDLILLWDGSEAQPIPTLSYRTEKWNGRTYGDLRRLFSALRAAASRHGLENFRLGTQCCAHGHLKNGIYSIHAPFNDRHPEAYQSPTTLLLYAMPLKADSERYATFPKGIPAGTTWTEVFAKQWGALSRWLGMDAILLRDYFLSLSCYVRNGQFGNTASPDPAKNAAITQGAIELFRQVKQANTDAFVLGYSWATTAVGEWRVAGADLEAVVADGHIDAFIDQTWGGAWQDWWSYQRIGWTMQVANLLVHGAMIAKANLKRAKPCRFYNLIETWDGWEPWDTLHQTPDKLRWGIWAFSHAAVRTPTGLKTPDGSYIAWVNERHEGRIWSADDVEFVRHHLDAAQASAAQLEHVHGPAIVYNRPFLEHVHQTQPTENFSEWIDDQAGMLMKWGTPCLSATRIEWFDPKKCDAALLQTPQVFEKSKLRDYPAVVIGRADVIDPVLLKLCGVQTEGAVQPANFRDVECDATTKVVGKLHKSHFPAMQPVRAEKPVAWTKESALVAAKGALIYWQPPDWLFPQQTTFRFCQYGSYASHYAAARTLDAALQKTGRPHVANVRHELPVSVHLWRSAGKLHVLVGNLESGEIGDSRTSRVVELVLPELPAGNWVLREVERGDVVKPVGLRFTIPVAPQGSGVYQLERSA